MTTVTDQWRPEPKGLAYKFWDAIGLVDHPKPQVPSVIGQHNHIKGTLINFKKRVKPLVGVELNPGPEGTQGDAAFLADLKASNRSDDLSRPNSRNDWSGSLVANELRLQQHEEEGKRQLAAQNHRPDLPEWTEEYTRQYLRDREEARRLNQLYNSQPSSDFDFSEQPVNPLVSTKPSKPEVQLPLIGVEPNPGPDKKKKLSKAIRAEEKLAIAKFKSGRTLKVKPLVAQRFAAPVNTGFTLSGRKPIMKTVNGVTTITHREYVKDLMSNATAQQYEVESHSINTANSAIFPWLSNIANMYGQFRFKRLSFEIESLVATSVSGMSGLAVTPDCTDPSPSQKSEFLQLVHSSRANAWLPNRYEVPKDILTRVPRFITASADVQAANDKSVGLFTVCSDAFTTAGVRFGELYVSYIVELFDEQPPSYITITTTNVANSQPWFNIANTVVNTNQDIKVGYELNAVGIVGNDAACVISKGYDEVIIVLTISGTTISVAPTLAVRNEYVATTGITITTIASQINTAATFFIGMYVFGKLTSPFDISITGQTAVSYTGKAMYMFPISIATGIVSVEERLKNLESSKSGDVWLKLAALQEQLDKIQYSDAESDILPNTTPSLTNSLLLSNIKNLLK